MIYTKEDILKIDEKLKNGLKLKRKERIYHNNIFGVRKSGIKYAMDYSEIEEYNKCKNSIFYFIEKYFNIKIRNYQKDFLNLVENNRFNIWMHSREIGSITIKALYYLHNLIFNRDKNIVLFSNKKMVSVELLNKIKEFYIKIPFFLKSGVLNWNDNKIFFEDMNTIYAFSITKESPIGFTFNIVDMCDISKVPSETFNMFYRSLIPTVSSIKDSKIIISSTLNGYNHFYELVKNSELDEDDPNKNLYNTLRTYWWEIPNRDEKWRKEKINLLGNKMFRMEYELSIT
jgi:hypothetical protein